MTPSARPTLLHQMIDQAAQRRPESEAIRGEGGTLTYGELARRANGLARLLLDTGLERRARVAVFLGRGLEVPVAFYGTLAAGGALVPIDPRSPAEQLIRILRATGATHLVSQPARRQLVRQAAAACPELSRVIGLEPDDDLELSVLPWSAVDEEASDAPPPAATIALDPAYVLHTSGSTGTPKLILHTHASAMSFVDWAVAEYGLRPEDRLSNHSSHHTCFATFDYYAAARAGATTVLLTPAALMMPGSLSALLERERVSVWYSVPTALVHLSLRGDLEARDLDSLRWVLFAGETFPGKHLRRIMRQLPAARFSHVYGSTEVNVCTYHHLGGPEELGEPLPIGKACSTSRTLVVDEDLEPVPDGEVGELLVRGSTVMSGYWGDLEASRRALVRRPAAGGFEEVYFRTGDRVKLLDSGDLTFVARADFQVKVRGHRVELEEVETALLSLEPVEEAAVFAVADGEGSRALRAVVVTAAADDARANELRAGLSKILPAHAVPAGITTMGALPRTPTGKVDRAALQARLAHGDDDNAT
jgi:amino acid adenylation domain-containing protein